MRKRSIDEWRQLLIGNTYNLLTVTDVVKVDNVMMSVCTCKCGNTKYAAPSRVFHNKIKSCGCLNNAENLSSRHTERHRRKLEQLKDQFINTRFGSLVVQDVIINKDNSIVCVCKCDCGVIIEISPKRLNHLKSCGCRSNVSLRVNIEDLKKEYIGKEINWFTISDIFRDDNNTIVFKCICKCGNVRCLTKKVILGKHPPMSCGCFKSSDECKDKHKLAWTPEIRRKMSEFYKNNPDKCKTRSNNSRITWLKNRDRNRERLLSAHNSKRVRALNKIDTSFIHPDDVSILKSGVRSDVKVRTRCPACGKYEYHTAYHVINYDAFTVYQRMCSYCSKSFSSSKYEQEIADYISTFYFGELIRNDRIILNGKELDLYYPEKKIAIEFNGDYWHDENHKSKDYHYNKFKACLDHNILLISIFELEWNSKKEEIKDYIQYTFNGASSSISFKGDLMNNNYPSLECLSRLGEYIEESYSVNDVQISTCGYSRIISNT